MAPHLRTVDSIFRFIQQGTADLTLRLGLNSGPTTAGVLRGEKARFQLFGDVSLRDMMHQLETTGGLHSSFVSSLRQTVNTAARMESNGKPGQIQVSQKTADLIILGGKRYVNKAASSLPWIKFLTQTACLVK